uniref:Uncharacterized protein n=1 Tax=Rhizophora mucronata TaxID=61149 RepID=A0A2P2PYP2_RHIMU
MFNSVALWASIDILNIGSSCPYQLVQC